MLKYITRKILLLICYVRWPSLCIKKTYIHPFSNVYKNFNIGYFSNINGKCFVSPDSDVLVIIGNYCAIANNLRIRLSNHDTHHIQLQYKLQKELGLKSLRVTKGDVIINNNVWIGDNVIILPGVSIGEGAVIGAGSVVTKNINPYTINVGVPCREVKKRFTEDIIDLILSRNIFDHNIESIKKYKNLFCTTNQAEILSILESE